MVEPTSAAADPDRLARAYALIDEANAADPNTIEVDGVARPKEQAHAELMTEWVQRLDPAATEAQLLAARAHHLRRWSIPRSSYPDGRAGYLRWRTALKNQHAEEVAELLVAAGYGPETVGRVQEIIRKESLHRDAQVQSHEDALCLVFLQTQLDAVAVQLGEEKAVDVLAKTLAKMSPAAVEVGASLPMSEGASRLLARGRARMSYADGPRGPDG